METNKHTDASIHHMPSACKSSGITSSYMWAMFDDAMSSIIKEKRQKQQQCSSQIQRLFLNAFCHFGRKEQKLVQHCLFKLHTV